MKIVRVDNLNRDYVEEILVCENVHEGYGQQIVDWLNSDDERCYQDWFELKADDYKLWRGREEFI